MDRRRPLNDGFAVEMSATTWTAVAKNGKMAPIVHFSAENSESRAEKRRLRHVWRRCLLVFGISYFTKHHKYLQRNWLQETHYGWVCVKIAKNCKGCGACFGEASRWKSDLRIAERSWMSDLWRR